MNKHFNNHWSPSELWRHTEIYPDSKVYGANMEPTWVLSAPGGPHVGPIWLLHWHWGNSMIDPMSVKYPEWYGWSWPVPYHHKTKQNQNRVYNSGKVLYKNVLHDALALTCMWSRSSAITIVTKLKLNCLCLSYDIFGINKNRRRYWGPMTVTRSILWI